MFSTVYRLISAVRVKGPQRKTIEAKQVRITEGRFVLF